MPKVDASLVKRLREATAAPMMECKRALEEAQGDLERAAELLRVRGLARAAKRAGREAREGLVAAYVHPGGRVGVLLEVNCETDFVARTEEFARLVKDLTLQIAAMAPQYVDVQDIPAEELERLREGYYQEALRQGKPEHIAQRFAQGKLERYLSEICLLRQPFVRDETRTVGELVQEAIAKLGENVVVRRFVRYQLGEA